MVKIEERAAKDLVHRPCWGEFRRHFTGDFECRSRWRAFDSYWETGSEESGALRRFWLRYKRCRFPPVHYLTKFQVWILLLPGKRELLRRILLEIDTSAGDEASLLGDWCNMLL